MNKKLIATLNGTTHTTPPIWLMRQAGRYLPEYRETRKKAGGFLDLCYNSDLATEVTLQPLRRFELDAAILFADILLVPDALGMKVWFEEGEGPRLDGISNGFNINNLKSVSDIHERLAPIYQTVKNLSSEIPKTSTLIGFAGAPWTVATYMIAGKGSKDFSESKAFMFQEEEKFNQLINIITLATVEYLSAQIEAGAEVIKIFDSWAGVLSERKMTAYVYDPIVKIASELKKRHENIPIIVFPRGVGPSYKVFAKNELFSGLAIDTSIPAAWAKKELQNSIAVQGNLDPELLPGDGSTLKEEVENLLDNLRNGPYIFNLGHGITPKARPENIQKLIDFIRSKN
ncbi:MAG: uroporphyrinogen decarboxylase [Pseudomonadota bacterium]|nr:uroporphyrinogen decarboxylase [Pseudomonadota bacterium]